MALFPTYGILKHLEHQHSDIRYTRTKRATLIRVLYKQQADPCNLLLHPTPTMDSTGKFEVYLKNYETLFGEPGGESTSKFEGH